MIALLYSDSFQPLMFIVHGVQDLTVIRYYHFIITAFKIVAYILQCTLVV